MTGGSKGRTAPAIGEVNHGHGEVKRVSRQTIVNKLMDVLQQFAGRYFPVELMQRFRVNAVRHQRRADAVTRYVADHDLENIILGEHYPEVSAYAMSWVVVSLYRDTIPHDAPRCERFLYPYGERQLSFNFCLAPL